MLNMHRSASALLFPGYRRRVLGLLLLRPEEALHGREIARRTGLPAGTLTRELKVLAEAGLLSQERRGNQILYSANRGSPIYMELAAILRKTSGLADLVAESLAPLSNETDVDLLIVGATSFGAVVEALHPVQQQLSREINPKVFTAREWIAKRKQKNPF